MTLATTRTTEQTDGLELSGHELFRRVNDRVRELLDEPDDEEFYFFCECEDNNCTSVLRMTASEYDALRNSDDFAVLPDHTHPEEDVIVGWGDGYTLVRPWRSWHVDGMWY